jgi:ferritin-like metal-binding protein YciE
MAASEMKELLKHELGDLLYAEQLILKMLGTLTKEVKNPEVLARIQEHVGETEGQIERLKRAFESIGEKAKAEKCDAAVGLKEEHDSFKKEEKPSKQLLEAFDLGNGLRVEHYEIAGYRSAIAVASVLGASECVALLTQSLREEEQMASFLERNAVKALKLLNTGMEFSEGKAEVLFTAETGSRRGGTAKSSKSGSSSARSGGSRSNGRSTADSGKSGGSSSGGKSSTASKSASKTAGKSASKTASKSSSRSSGGSSSRTTAERSSSGGKSGGTAAKSSSKSGGSSSGSKSSGSKSGGSKSGGSRSGGSRSGGGARA